ncbi:cell division protein FtsZ [Firmicutes bacterium CAG:449]|nr:cell division protein FtsZ [Firmicutes bacterium CAG:449]
MEEFNLDAFESYAKIVVVGCGGGGSNAVNQMVEEQMRGVTFWVCNTDAQALATSKAEHRLVLGKDITNGLGAGGNPEVGRKAAESSLDDIYEVLQGANMVFIAAGMGGGTGTGAAPIVAKAAKDLGALTVAIVTRPFSFEGERRRKNAIEGINALKEVVDAIIIVSNDKLMMMNGTRPIGEAFAESDRVLAQSVKTITDLIVVPGVINLDFADVKATLQDKGLALIGFGTGSGPKKANDAASSALLSPLLEASIHGAHSIIANVTCGNNVSLDEVKESIDYITSAAGNTPNIIFGVQENPELNDQMLISIVATEFDNDFDPFEEKTPLVNPLPTPQVEEEVEEDEEDSILPEFLNK